MPVMKQLNMGGTTYDTVGEASVTRVVTSGTKIATITIDGTSSDLYAPSGTSVDPATSAPIMDGTAAVGSSVKYAREDHVHPTDTSRQAALVSGTNIKTVNNESLLGSGNITIDGGTAMTDAEVEEAVDDGWGSASLYSITTESSALTFWESWSDEHNVSGQITSAAQGTTVYIDYSPGSPSQMTPSVSMSGGGTVSVTDEYSAFAPPFGGVYSFTMPDDDVTVSLEV